MNNYINFNKLTPKQITDLMFYAYAKDYPVIGIKEDIERQIIELSALEEYTIAVGDILTIPSETLNESKLLFNEVGDE